MKKKIRVVVLCIVMGNTNLSLAELLPAESLGEAYRLSRSSNPVERVYALDIIHCAPPLDGYNSTFFYAADALNSPELLQKKLHRSAWYKQQLVKNKSKSVSSLSTASSINPYRHGSSSSYDTLPATIAYYALQKKSKKS
ncbi:MAG: hypothetical protein WD068_01350 [Candidatus Babeliales bacterium]